MHVAGVGAEKTHDACVQSCPLEMSHYMLSMCAMDVRCAGPWSSHAARQIAQRMALRAALQLERDAAIIEASPAIFPPWLYQLRRKW